MILNKQEILMAHDMAFRVGKLVYLRPLRLADAPALQRWVNDPEITQFLTRILPATEREEIEWKSKGKTKRMWFWQ